MRPAQIKGSSRQSIVIAGCGKNVVHHAELIYNNFLTLSDAGYDVRFVWVENGSVDGTKQLFKSLAATNSNFVWLELEWLNKIQERTLRLELARNAYIDFVLNHHEWSLSDYLIVVDLDEINSGFNNFGELINGMDFLMGDFDRAGFFANQFPLYYDLWALRHPELSPVDPLLDFARATYRSSSRQEAVKSKSLLEVLQNLSFDSGHGFFEVDSAFGGLGCYKLSSIRKAVSRYKGIEFVSLDESRVGVDLLKKAQVCEHVFFS